MKDLKVILKHEIGLKDYGEGDSTELALTGNTLHIKAKAYKRPELDFPVESISSARISSNTQRQEKDKSVLGRAAAGAVIFGSVGAVVGGMSGIGKKQKKTTKTEVIFEIDGFGQVRFELVGATNMKKLIQLIKTLCPEQL